MNTANDILSPSHIEISVVIVTADRPQPLADTLESFRGLNVPSHLPTELLVMDNSRTKSDAVKQVVESADLPRFEQVRYIRVATPGKCYGINLALKKAVGQIFLFIDDDVHPIPDWLIRMSDPIRHNEADSLSGGIRLASHLVRPWMERMHMGMMASTEWLQPGEQLPALIGANLGFHRRVLEKVPAYDLELDPATLYGGGEEILFSYQLDEAGFRRTTITDIIVDHHFNPDRLAGDVLRRRMSKVGREHVYIMHHWQHEPIYHVRRNFIRSYLDMKKVQRQMQTEWQYPEGISLREMKAIEMHYFYRQALTELQRPRNYDLRGLVKLRGVLPDNEG
jgi:glycosyltransferase involved in cell wall biosynthesis